ncbi:MAG: trypsin-like peptidase domain-containing protein [Planctomycetes bacterium]|nr:trypsin-like peptidase domain-containing protein [Planctomycetota bacterium]
MDTLSDSPRPREPRAGLIPALLVLSVVLSVLLVRQLLHQPDGATPRPVTPRGELSATEQTTIDIFREVSPSVVHITNYRVVERGPLRLDPTAIKKGTGTGFIWNEDGYIVTNFHVVQGGQRWRVTFSDNSVLEAREIGGSASNDLAVLKVDAPAEKLKKIALGTSHDLQVGQAVLAIGNPFGFDHTLTTGVISGLDRQISGANGVPIKDVIQTDAAINPGNSGGPLLDSAGRMIGVNTALVSLSGASAGIGFAVPVDTVNEVVTRLIRHPAARPSLGIDLWSDSQARRWRETGAIIREIEPGGPADQAGLKPSVDTQRGVYVGDVIVKLGRHLIRSRRDLSRALATFEVGDRVDITVRRDRKLKTTSVTLQAAKEQ